MGDAQNAKITAVDSKIKDITDFLKSSVLEPAAQEKVQIVENAKKEAAKIVADARKEAEEIISNARKEAEVTKHNTESALKIAAKQSVDRLKLTLEKEVLSSAVVAPVKGAMQSEQLIKEFVVEVLKLYSQKGAFTISLDDSMKAKIKDYVADQIAKCGAGSIKLSDETLPNGFAVISDNGVLRYDFTDESVEELLTEYIRPELRKTLFAK